MNVHSHGEPSQSSDGSLPQVFRWPQSELSVWNQYLIRAESNPLVTVRLATLLVEQTTTAASFTACRLAGRLLLRKRRILLRLLSRFAPVGRRIVSMIARSRLLLIVPTRGVALSVC
jgi:hypothetical protein